MKGRDPPFEQTWIPFKQDCLKTCIPLIQGCIVSILVQIVLVVLEKRFLNFINVFQYFIISPWKSVGPTIWADLHSFTQGCILTSLVEIDPVAREKKIFIFYQLKRAGALYKNNLESLNSRIHCANVGGNWSSGSWEEDEHVKSLRQRKRQRWQQRQRRRTADKFWSEKLTWAFAQVS